uniref:Uncharacterized protein n=1 Tax=Anguilla anguilla TaxID=7936 RepID=A0A0E9T465_ANGAN
MVKYCTTLHEQKVMKQTLLRN